MFSTCTCEVCIVLFIVRLQQFSDTWVSIVTTIMKKMYVVDWMKLILVEYSVL